MIVPLPAVEAVPFSFPGIDGVRCLFSTIHAGDMRRADGDDPDDRRRANFSRFMANAGLDRWSELRQVHGDAIVEAAARAGNGGVLAEADGHYTRSGKLGLVIRTADCQPLLIARDDGQAVAALHVGWRGNAMNFPGSAVRRLCAEFACGPERLLAVRGPSLGPTASEFVNFDREWPAEFAPWFDRERKTVNLWALTRHQLATAGMVPERIFSLDMCTLIMRDHFFSYRRKDAERQIGVVWID